MSGMVVLMLSFVATAAAPGGAAPQRGSLSSSVTLHDCLISVKEQAEVPAQEPGILMAIEVEEGMPIKREQLLAQIDASEREMQRGLAVLEYEKAKEEATNDIEVRYAQAATKVAEAEYDAAVDANRRVAGTIPVPEVRRLKLAWDRAALQIEQSQVKQRLTGLEARVKAAEVDAAETNIQRRRLNSPLDGEVVAVHKHVGEWVNPGDAVLSVVRFDRVRVEGFVKASQYNPRQIADRPVTVEIELAQGEKHAVNGKVTYVSQQVQAGGEYRVWCEVDNVRLAGFWVLRPGLTATMTVHLQPSAPEPASR